MPDVSEVWIVARPLPDDSGIILSGVFNTEMKAIGCCYPGEFVALVDVDERLPMEAADVKKLYFPHESNWERSMLCHLQRRAREIVDQFFRNQPCR